MSDTPPQSKEQSPKFKFNLFYILIAAWLLILGRDFTQFQRNVETIPYSQFISYLDSKQVADVAVGQQQIQGTLKNAPPGRPKEFLTLKLEDPNLTQRLHTAGVARYSAIYESTVFKEFLSWLLPVFIIMSIGWIMMRRMGQARTEFLSFGKSKAKIYAEKDLKTRFTDVAGVNEPKAELEEVVEFLKNPKTYSKLGGHMPKGVLLVGPPGTGKTLLARAVAGETGVPFFYINGSEFVELFVGLGAARVRDLFNQARSHAPCIIFIDELDALGRARGLNSITGTSNDEKEQTLNQLLAELDGFDSSAGIILLAATNRPEVLDPALLRAGRFDRQIMVDKPDRTGREEILKVHLRNVKASPQLDIAMIASLTAGFSGADLANLSNEAALIATRRKAEEVMLRDITEAIERLVAGLERKTRLLGPEEKRRVAYHEMGHATVALALGKGEAVHKVTIIPRGLGALGYTFRRPTEDRYLISSKELECKLAMLLGGRAAETIFFQDISTGAADDLDKATEIARSMITRYGMSRKIGLMTLEKPSSPLGTHNPFYQHEYSEALAYTIDQEIYVLLESSVKAAQDCLIQFKEFVHEAVQELLAQETLDEHQLKKLWGKYQYLAQVS
jgi:cell division protease FtsH